LEAFDVFSLVNTILILVSHCKYIDKSFHGLHNAQDILVLACLIFALVSTGLVLSYLQYISWSIHQVFLRAGGLWISSFWPVCLLL
jgi:hypothetical protein